MDKRELFLCLTAICGELPCNLAGYAVGSNSYAASLITKLKREGYLAVRKKDGIRGYTLKAKGKRELLEKYPDDFSLFLTGSVETNHVKSEPQKRLRLHRMGMAWIYFYRMDAGIFVTEKPAFPPSVNEVRDRMAYYGAMELKGGSDKVKGSRACGVLVSNKMPFVVYHTMDQLMKWAKKTERSMRSYTEGLFVNRGFSYQADAVMIGLSIKMLMVLLDSDGGIKKNLFCVDDIYEHYYFIPMGVDSFAQLTLITRETARGRFYDFLCQTLFRREEKDYALMAGYDESGIPVYFCYELELRSLMRIKQEMGWKGLGKIVCLDYQAEALRSYYGKEVEVLAILPEKVTEYIREC